MKNHFNRYVCVSFGIISGAFIVAVAAFYFLAADISSRASVVSANRAQIAKQNNSLASFAEIKQDSDEASKYKAAMDKLLPAQDELINYPKWLQNVAATYNITADFSFTANTVPAAAASPGTVGFSLTVEGENNNLVSFLKNIESQAPGFLLSFDSFNLTKNGDDTKIVTGGNMFFR